MVLVIYLVDRVRLVALHSTEALGEVNGTTDGRFAGLAGEALWQSLTADAGAADGADPALVESVRRHYAEVLERHIGELFEEGSMDGRQGVRVAPPSTRTIKTAGGAVSSWLPAAESTQIYYLGHERAAAGLDQLDGLRNRLDELGAKLFEKTGCRPSGRLSDIWLPRANPLLVSSAEPEVVPAVLAVPEPEHASVAPSPLQPAA